MAVSVGFDVGTDSHVSWYGATITRTTTDTHSGAGALSFVANEGFAGVDLSNWPGFAGVTAGEEVRPTLWVKGVGSFDTSLSWTVRFRNESGAEQGTATTYTVPVTSSWAEFVAPANLTVPTGATRVAWTFDTNASGVGSTILLDDITVNEPPPPSGDPGWGVILLEDGSGAYELEGSTDDDYLLDTSEADPGTGIPEGNGTGALVFAGTATGKRTPKASGTGSLGFTGSAVGDAPSVPPGTGSGTGTLAFAGSAAGKRVAKATGSGTVTFTGTATGRTVRRGTGTGSLAFAGTAVGKRPAKGSGNGTLAFVGTATGKRAPKATGSGGLTFTGAALGDAPAPGLQEGFGSGSLTFTGTAVGKRSPKGGGSGSLAFAGSATGARQPKASGIGTLVLEGTAIGERQPVATGSGLLLWVGAGLGAATAPVTYSLTVADAPPAHTVSDAPPALVVSDAPPAHTVTSAPAAHTVRTTP